MSKHEPTRFFSALLCAAVVTIALPVASYAMDERSSDSSADTGEMDVPPPESSDEMPFGTDGDGPPPERPSANTEKPRPSTAAKPVQSNEAAKNGAREAAKRALFGDPKKDSDKPNPYLDVRSTDYYDRRAKDLLQSEMDKSKVELHPLMQAHPDSYVVVCTAGCVSGRGAEIVSMLPKPAANQSPSAAPATINGGNVISCVAGCGADGYTSIASTPDSGTAVAATVGEWMTTVAKVPASAEAPAPKSAGSGDWMDKINQDRAGQQKAATPSAPTQTAVTPSTPAQTAVTPSTPAKSDVPVEAKVSQPKPATPSVTEAPKAETPAATKPAAVAETKPAGTPVETKPMATVTAQAKPAAAVAEAKPAPAATVEPKPVPSVTANAKPAPVTASPAATPPASQPVVVSGAAKTAKAPAKAPAQAKTAEPDQKAATPKAVQTPATQMAALETPKAPAAAPVVKQPGAAPEAGNGSLFKDSAKVSTPAPAPAAEPKPATPPAVAVETKPAASNGSLFNDSAKVSVASPNPKPATAPAATANEKPTSTNGSLFKDQTKVAAVAPPAADQPAPAIPAKQKDGVISVLSEDKDMNAAIQKARGALSSFWTSYGSPAAGEADHALKVAVAGNGTTEHFWLTRIKREAGKISGVISNQPQSVKTVKVGQRYEFTEDMISDWTFKRNGKLVGNETMRVLLPRMPEEQAAVYRKMYETP